jgi:hypothetical protein
LMPFSPLKKTPYLYAARIFVPCPLRYITVIDSMPVQTVVDFNLLRCNKGTPISFAQFFYRSLCEEIWMKLKVLPCRCELFRLVWQQLCGLLWKE